MGLVGYNDRDRTNNEKMNSTLNSMYGFSYVKRNKIKDVTKKREKKEKIYYCFEPKIKLTSSQVKEFDELLDDFISFLNKINRKTLISIVASLNPSKETVYEKIFEESEKLYQYLEDILDIKGYRISFDVVWLCQIYVSNVLHYKRNVQKKIKKCMKDYCLCHMHAVLEISEEEKELYKNIKENRKLLLKLKLNYQKIEDEINIFEKIYEQIKLEMDVESEYAIKLINEKQQKRKELHIQILEIIRYEEENIKKYENIITKFNFQKKRT